MVDTKEIKAEESISIPWKVFWTDGRREDPKQSEDDGRSSLAAVKIITLSRSFSAAPFHGLLGKAKEAGLLRVDVVDLRDLPKTATVSAMTIRTGAGAAWC